MKKNIKNLVVSLMLGLVLAQGGAQTFAAQDKDLPYWLSLEAEQGISNRAILDFPYWLSIEGPEAEQGISTYAILDFPYWL
ncbi:MAG: hypothetical protein ACRCS6_04275 [Turicibacter sp.]